MTLKGDAEVSLAANTTTGPEVKAVYSRFHRAGPPAWFQQARLPLPIATGAGPPPWAQGDGTVIPVDLLNRERS